MTLEELWEAQRFLEDAVPKVREQVLRNPDLWPQMPLVVQLESGVALSKRLLKESVRACGGTAT